MKDPKRFYTYAYLREDGSPYYIGKGQGRRITNRGKLDVKPPKDKTGIIFLKQNISEEEAFKHEKYMIAVLGRKDLGTGILRNKTDGGVAPTNLSMETRKKMSDAHKGKIVSEETRRKQSECRKGELNGFYGKKHSEETLRKLKVKHTGKKHSEKHKMKISESGRGRVLSSVARENIGKAKFGEKNPAYGKRWWNDGCGNCKLELESPGEGWTLGRKYK